MHVDGIETTPVMRTGGLLCGQSMTTYGKPLKLVQDHSEHSGALSGISRNLLIPVIEALMLSQHNFIAVSLLCD